MAYIHLQKEWPAFTWDNHTIIQSLSAVRHNQGRLIGKLEGLGFQLRKEATLETLTLDVMKSSEIEGEKLPAEQVRSSIAKRLGIEVAGIITVDRNVEGVVDMMIDATQNYDRTLTDDRLFGWHSALFPTGRSGMHKIVVGSWRDDSTGPMQVVSGALGKEHVHFEAPAAIRVKSEIHTF